jgi:hypothetical protein
MTAHQLDPTGARSIACTRCGARFECRPGGACWCCDETVRLPMPVEGEDCLCQACLRAAAAGAADAAAAS